MEPTRRNSSQIARPTLCAAIIATVCVAQGAAATSDLPVYPGAAKLAAAINSSYCGHKTAVVTYNSAAAGKTVAKWYEGKIAGAVLVDESGTDSGSIDTQLQVFTPDGSASTYIHQMSMASARLQAAAKSIGADKTTIGLETYTPPMGADYVALLQRAAHGDAAARAAILAKCPQN